MFAVAGALSFRAQTVTPTVLSNQGGYSALSGGSISWSIGEPVSESWYNGPHTITNGFHQPELNFILMIKEQGTDASVLVYPNPVKEIINVNFTGLKEGNYKIQLIDNIGKLLYSSETEISESHNFYQMKIGEVAAGNYFLRVDSKDFSKTVKINKVN